jgi:hypothetical protein
MKKLFILIVTGAVLAGCGKENTLSTSISSAAFINASPGTPSFQILGDTMQLTSTALALRANSGYLGFTPGTRRIEVKSGTNNANSHINATTQTFDQGSAYTYIVYDTLAGATTATTGSLRFARLNDNLALPNAGLVKVRFIHTAINAPAVDVTLLRTSATTPDSVTISNASYIGNTPNVNALSTFSNIPAGTYSIRVKLAGTQTLALIPAPSATLTATQGIYTLFATGTAKGQPLSVGAFRNYP